MLAVSWPTHGELKFTVSKRLAGNVFRRWLQLRMQAERLARREKAERFNLKPTQDVARQQPGSASGEEIAGGDVVAGHVAEGDAPAAAGDDWEVVTKVESSQPEPQDAVMESMPDRRDHGVAAKRRRKNNAGKAKQRLRRDGSTVSMPPDAVDADRAVVAKARPGTTGVPKPVRPRQRRQSPGAPQPAPGPMQNTDATGPLDMTPPSPPVPTPARVPTMPAKPAESLGSPTGAEVTNYLPAPPKPAKTGDGPATPADLPSADTSSPQAPTAADDPTNLSASDSPDPPRRPMSANPPAPVDSPLAEVTKTTTMIGRPLNVAPLVEGEQLAHFGKPPADRATDTATQSVTDQGTDRTTDQTTDLGAAPEPESPIDSSKIDLTTDLELPVIASDSDSAAGSPAIRPTAAGRRGEVDLLDAVDSRVATQPSWIGSPVSIIGAMVVISTFVLITATATASYRRSVAATEASDPADASLAGPSIPVRTTIDHQRFNPSVDAAVPLGPSGSMPQGSMADQSDATVDAGPDAGTGGQASPGSEVSPDVSVEPLDGGPTQASVVEGAPRLCNSNYSGCVPDVSDVDCPGDGDGPLYSTEPAVVMGQDVYGLDTDGDGETCEPDQPPQAEESTESGTATETDSGAETGG
ncbi:MAG: hypothetical protein ACRBK7_06860 [Acidimicrobiales bacterium]